MMAENLQHDNCSHSLLIQAIVNGQLEIVKGLLAKGISATAKDKLSGLTPLAVAAANGHEEIGRFLLQRADVNKQWAFDAFKEDIQKDLGGHSFPSETPRALAFKNGHIALAHTFSWSWTQFSLDPLKTFVFQALNLNRYFEPTCISTTESEIAATYCVQLGIKQPGERAFAGRYDVRGDPSFGPGVVERRLGELRNPESFVTSWQVPVFGKRVRSYSI